jgi:hypothetical protein
MVPSQVPAARRTEHFSVDFFRSTARLRTPLRVRRSPSLRSLDPPQRSLQLAPRKLTGSGENRPQNGFLEYIHFLFQSCFFSYLFG